MKLLWHLTAKDLRHLWPLIALFAVVIAAEPIIGVLLWQHDGPLSYEWFAKMDIYVKVIDGLMLLMSYLLTAAVVQTDSLIGTRAFWMTKPVSGLQLLGAKALALAMICGAVPFLVTLPWWIGCDLSAGEISRAAGEKIVPYFAAALFAWPVAALTGSLQRFLIWTLVIVASVVMGSVYLASHFGLQPDGTQWDVIQASRLRLSLLVGTLGSIAVVAHQYRTRRFARSTVLFAATLTLISLIAALWRWNWSLRGEPPAGADSALVQSVKIDGVSASLTSEIRQQGDTPETGVVSFKVEVSGVPTGYLLVSKRVNSEMLWPDGFRAPAPSRDPVLNSFMPMSPVPICETLGLPPPKVTRVPWPLSRSIKLPLEDLAPGNVDFLSAGLSTHAVVDHLRTAAPAYALDAIFELQRLIPLGESTWFSGTEIRRGSHYARVLSMGAEAAGDLRLSLVVRCTQASVNHQDRSARIPGAFALVNRANKDLSLGFDDGSYSSGPKFILISGVRLTWAKVVFTAPHQTSAVAGQPSSDANWFDGASLMWFVAEPIETFTRHFETTALPVEIDAPTPAKP